MVKTFKSCIFFSNMTILNFKISMLLLIPCNRMFLQKKSYIILGLTIGINKHMLRDSVIA